MKHIKSGFLSVVLSFSAMIFLSNTFAYTICKSNNCHTAKCENPSARYICCPVEKGSKTYAWLESNSDCKQGILTHPKSNCHPSDLQIAPGQTCEFRTGGLT